MHLSFELKLKYPTSLNCRKLPEGLERSLCRLVVSEGSSRLDLCKLLVVFVISHHPNISSTTGAILPSRSNHFMAGASFCCWMAAHFHSLRNNYILLYTIQLFPALGNKSPGPRSSPPLHPQTVVQLLTRTRHNTGFQKYLSYEKPRSDTLICFRCDPDVQSLAADLNLLFVFACQGK